MPQNPPDMKPGEFVSDGEYEISSVVINGVHHAINPPVRVMPGDRVCLRDLQALALPPKGAL